MRKIICCILITLCLILLGCTREHVQEAVEPSVKFVDSQTVINLQAPMPISKITDNTEQVMYLCANGKDEDGWKLYLINKQRVSKKVGDDIVCVELDMAGFYSPEAMFAGHKDDLYIIVKAASDISDVQYLVYHFGLDGEELGCMDITESCQCKNGETFSAIKTAVCDGEGRIYITGYNEDDNCVVLDEAGEFLSRITIQDGSIKELKSIGKKVYATVGKDGTSFAQILCEISVEAGKHKELWEIPESRGSVLMAGNTQGHIFLSDMDNVWIYNPEEGKSEKIFVWADAGVSGNEMHQIFTNGTDKVGAFWIGPERVFTRKSEIIYLEPETANSQTATNNASDITSTIEKAIVTICSFSADDTELREVVTLFNRQSEKYKVEIQIYENTEKLKTELMADKGPDLFPATVVGIKYLAQTGMAENLWPLLEKSERLSEDVLQSNVLETCTENDVLVCIPSKYSISTLIARASEVGTEAGWTTREFLEYVESRRGSSVFCYGDSRVYLIWNYMRSEWDNLVDYEQGKAGFDSSEFRQMLEYASEYEAFYDEDPGNYDERIKEGKVLFYDQLSGMWSYKHCEDIFEDDMAVIGWPHASGEPKHGILLNDRYSIRAGSDVKEGAWEFLEFLILRQEEEVQSSRHSGFPVYLPALETKFTYEKEHMVTSYVDEKGLWHSEYCIHEKDIENVREIINSASYLGGIDPMEEIIYEDIHAFLNGGPDIDQTIDVIQNRVQLFLDEMRKD